MNLSLDAPKITERSQRLLTQYTAMLDLEFASKLPRTDVKRETTAAMVARDLMLDMVYIEKMID